MHNNNKIKRMYYEDQFVNDDDVSLNSQKGKLNNILKKSNDKRFFQVKRVQQGGKRKNISIYGTGPLGWHIRNAVTGEKYNHLVGSKNEDLYFKVSYCTGENGQESQTLFYDTPEQYEKHLFYKVDEYIKEQWLNKCLFLREKISLSSKK